MALNYYTVPFIGTGTEDDPIRPDLPVGTPFAGSFNGSDFLIATTANLSGFGKAVQHMPLQALQTVCNARGLDINAVLTWNVGGA